MTQGRSLYKQIFQNFINSLKPKKFWGEFRGKDHYGTEYYESTESLQGHRSRPTRWFVPKDKDAFDQEIPPEWDAWLKYTRKQAPTEEEIQYNIQKMKLTIENAKKIDGPQTAKKDCHKAPASTFPVYEDIGHSSVEPKKEFKKN